MDRNNTLLPTASLLIAIALVAPAALANHGDLHLELLPVDPLGPTDCTGPVSDDALCPDSIRSPPVFGDLPGASCVSHGVLVVERDITGTGLVGDAVIDQSQARAWTWAVFGPWPDEAFEPFPNQERGEFGDPTRPPGDPAAHADAAQANVGYTHTASGLAVTARGVYAQCDVQAVADDPGLFTQAYGRGGVADLDVTLSGFPILGVEALDMEIDARGFPWVTAAAASCDLVELRILGPAFDGCPPANSGVTVLTVSVILNEQWGPVPNVAGQGVYGGAAVHIRVTTTVSVIDVYVGYVAVAVGMEAPAMQMFDIPGTVGSIL